QGARRAGLGAADRVRRGVGEHRRVVSVEPRLVGARAHRRVPLVLRPQLRSAMSIVVLGANGLVGSRIAARLAEAGERVIAVGRGPQRVQAKVEYHQLDLQFDPSGLAGIVTSTQARAVINSAAMTDVDACERQSVAAWTVNTGVVEIAAQVCTKYG